MNRRKFLLGTSALVASAAIPLPVIAKPMMLAMDMGSELSSTVIMVSTPGSDSNWYRQAFYEFDNSFYEREFVNGCFKSFESGIFWPEELDNHGHTGDAIAYALGNLPNKNSGLI